MVIKKDKAIILLSAIFILLSVLTTTIGCQQKANSVHRNQPNIILIYSDDHAAQAIGAYQNILQYGLKLDHSPTPNIDKLAENGIRYDNAFVTNSLCEPARAVLLTGKHSHKNGIYVNGNYSHIELKTFPQLLKKAVYQTAVFGKWHLGTKPKGFEDYGILQGQGSYYNPILQTPNGKKEISGYTTDIITERTLDWLKSKRDKDTPFFLMVNHKAPHRNWLPSKNNLNLYKNEKIPEPATLLYDHGGIANPGREHNLSIASELEWGWDFKMQTNPITGDSTNWGKVVRRNRLTSNQIQQIEASYEEENTIFHKNYKGWSDDKRLKWRYQRFIKDYLRVARNVDSSVGRLMDYLKQENLDNSTIVIYTSDQGYFLGENGWYDKRWIYDESMRIPLIIHWPNVVKPGSVSKKMVQNLDLAPTILDMANVDIPSRMQGRSMLSLLNNDFEKPWREAVYYHYYDGPKVPPHFGIRTRKYTLAYYYTYDEWELFALEKDPDQINNIYGESGYTDVQERLKKKLHQIQIKYEVK